MAIVKPFSALRPAPDLAAQICELPYDVMSSAEARKIAKDNPLSFLHVSKPEIDLDPAIDPYDSSVYAKATENFQKLISLGSLKRDSQPFYYLYRQIMGKHSQLGIVGVVSCEEYTKNIIKKHEFTRPDKEDDRVRHIEALNSQTGPVFLTYRADSVLDDLLDGMAARDPDMDFTAKDGVQHTSWVLNEPGALVEIESRFSAIPFLYIADGHHRSAAAVRVWQARKGAGSSGEFLAVIFPHDRLQILPYNRVLKDLNGLTPSALMQKLDGVFIINKGGKGVPSRKHELGLFIEGAWHTLHFRPAVATTRDPMEKLDVTLLQKHVLGPFFGIDDPRTSKRINFVGGIRGASELENLVRGGEYSCAFSMYPTGIDDLMQIADAGGIMPPKSTWFEPKLRDGMFCHMLD